MQCVPEQIGTCAACAYIVLPVSLSGMLPRAAIVGADLAISLWVIKACGAALNGAGSGVAFTDVAGITTTGPFAVSRNPMYVGLLLGMVPGCAVLLDSAWPLFFMAPLWLYIHLVVVRAEETMLTKHFGQSYEDYCATTPRYLLW